MSSGHSLNKQATEVQIPVILDIKLTQYCLLTSDQVERSSQRAIVCHKNRALRLHQLFCVYFC